ncbi:hypothetical protein LTR85_007128 [Meristemomyces frigidus]|nr:hypothetical protein LTR85_007128 [Meristemomyces frigidus]
MAIFALPKLALRDGECDSVGVAAASQNSLSDATQNAPLDSDNGEAKDVGVQPTNGSVTFDKLEEFRHGGADSADDRALTTNVWIHAVEMPEHTGAEEDHEDGVESSLEHRNDSTSRQSESSTSSEGHDIGVTPLIETHSDQDEERSMGVFPTDHRSGMVSPEPFLLRTQRAALFPLWREYPPGVPPQSSDALESKEDA